MNKLIHNTHRLQFNICAQLTASLPVEAEVVRECPDATRPMPVRRAWETPSGRAHNHAQLQNAPPQSVRPPSVRALIHAPEHGPPTPEWKVHFPWQHRTHRTSTRHPSHNNPAGPADARPIDSRRPRPRTCLVAACLSASRETVQTAKCRPYRPTPANGFPPIPSCPGRAVVGRTRE
jgi:hypothetical protein